MKIVDRQDILNTHSTDDPLFLSFNGNLVGMIKLSDYNQWYPVFVNRSFGYDYKTQTSIANPENIISIHLSDIIDWAISKGFEICKN